MPLKVKTDVLAEGDVDSETQQMKVSWVVGGWDVGVRDHTAVMTNTIAVVTMGSAEVTHITRQVWETKLNIDRAG